MHFFKLLKVIYADGRVEKGRWHEDKYLGE